MSLPVHLAPDLVGVAAGDRVVLTGDEAHHAVVVRRLRVGERVALTDGRGSWVEAVVEVTGKRELTAVAETVTRVARPEPAVTVVQALPKGDRGELAVEVLTEVGVDVVVPWAASRSVAVWRGERVGKSLAKWRATAREAAISGTLTLEQQIAAGKAHFTGTCSVCHQDSGLGAVFADAPRAVEIVEQTVLVVLGDLAEVPDVARLVLCVPIDRVLVHFAIDRDDVAHGDALVVADHGGLVGNGDPSRLDLLAVAGLVDECSTGLPRQEAVGDLGR